LGYSNTKTAHQAFLLLICRVNIPCRVEGSDETLIFIQLFIDGMLEERLEEPVKMQPVILVPCDMCDGVDQTI
jgi:hypothetical protein